jgi:hypothetical protein
VALVHPDATIRNAIDVLRNISRISSIGIP